MLELTSGEPFFLTIPDRSTDTGSGWPLRFANLFANSNFCVIRIRKQQILSNRLVWAAVAGTLVWFADQPTVQGYNPLLEMFWDPGVWKIPYWDDAVLLCSWLLTTLFCHFLFFAFRKARERSYKS